jgi:hypothetical protein
VANPVASAETAAAMNLAWLFAQMERQAPPWQVLELKIAFSLQPLAVSLVFHLAFTSFPAHAHSPHGTTTRFSL